MRSLHAIAPIALAALAGCYDPGDLGDAPFKCYDQSPECPDGYVCNGKFCVRENITKNPLTIQKSGTYAGMHVDPMLDGANCPDKDVEPNDAYGRATPLSSDAPLANMAICPSGDIDYFKLSTSGQYVRAQITYQVKYGDLDVAIVDANGMVVTADGTAKDNGCIATNSPLTGDVYIGVVGAEGKDQGLYNVVATLSPTSIKCQ